MRRLLGFLAVPVLLLGLTWLVAVIYLQQTGGEVTGQTLLNGFVIAPAVLIACWFGLKGLFSLLSHKPAATASAEPPAQPEAAPGPAAEPVQPALAILSAEISTAQSYHIDDLLAGLNDNAIRPALSDRFVDENGLPVMVALREDLDTESVSEFVSQWLLAAADTHPAKEDPDRAHRMLALLDAPVAASLDLLASLPAQTAQSSTAGAQAGKRPLLIKIFAERGWEDLVEAWLRKQFAALDGINPGFVRGDPERPELQHDALRVSGAFSSELARIPAASMMMLVACDSHGTDAVIERAGYDGKLFSAGNQNGMIPGEAAAAIVIAPADRVPEGLDVIAELQPAAWGRRQKAVDAGGRTDVELMTRLTASLLEKSSLTADAIGAFVSDCDQRSAWNAEAASLISSMLPGLDPVADHLSLGRALGHTGAAASTLALACAAACVRETNQPGLVASLTDPLQRSLALLRPLQAST